MKFPEEVDVNEAAIKKIVDFYKTAYAQITAELETATNFGIANRKAILKQVEVILQEFHVEASEIISDEISRAYGLGADQSVDQLQSVGADVAIKTGFNRIHRDAIEVLIDDTQKAFAESIQGVNRSASRLLGKAVRDQLSERMAVGKVGGKALRDIQKSLVQTFRADGLDSLTDKAGRGWSLERYSEMLIRTKTVEARNRGLVNRMVENDYDLVQVSAHAGCDLCSPWEGKILSVTGKTRGYPTVSQAESSGLFHPNCKHAINTLIPSLAKVTNAYNPNKDTLTGNDFVDEVDEKLKGFYKPPTQIIEPKTPRR